METTASGLDAAARPADAGPAAGRRQVWSIGELARLSGVTSRTLRHYGAIGLLEPVGVAAGGRRLYGHAELLRLQQVMVLRRLGVDLTTIGAILDAVIDAPAGSDPAAGRREVTLLREHHQRLITERDRLDRLARTVASTIESLEGGHAMAPKDLFAGFDNSQYETEVRERWGNAAWTGSNAVWARLGSDGQAAFHAEGEAIGRGLAELLGQDVAVTDERVQALVGRHFAQVGTFWTPDADSYRGLGQVYVDDQRFTAMYDAFAPGLAVYLRDAIDRFAATRL